ncbi:MAG: hypothetical protein KGD59_08575 [Candidatus Heimdallarchaeota archaeon]|nr:hypothetical protein [Candidatus Heimdallarchaeota archaeon]MBY8994591.1 hypothetical protein [Candidatus Heimdallarchaeota archaeon]
MSSPNDKGVPPEHRPMAKDDNKEDLIFDGMLFAVNDETGPVLRLNISSLSEREAITTAIHGITAIGLGEDRNRGLFGPIPVPYNTDYRALIYVFYVESETSKDPLIQGKGQFCGLFFIFKKDMIRYIANVYSMLESLLNMYQENYLLKEDQLQNDTIQYIYDDLITNLKLKPKTRVFRVNDGITVEFEDGTVKLGNEITFLISEKNKIFHYYFPKNLENDKKDHAMKILEHILKSEYQNSYESKKISSKKAFENLLKKNDITIIN